MRLSIIVPAVGPQSDLDNTLVSVLENRPANTEIVVPHAEKYQDPYGLSDEVRFVASDGDQPLHLLNVGIQASRGEVIHLLHSGMEVTPNWTASILDRFDAEPDVAAIGSSIKGPSKAHLAGVRYRAGGTAKHVRVKRRQTAEIDGPCIEAGFFRESTLTAIGPFDEELGVHHANADTAAKLRRTGLQSVHEPASLIAGTVCSRPPGYRSSQCIERIYRRHRRAIGPVPALQHLFTVATNVTRHGPSVGVISSMFGHCLGNVRSRISRSTNWEPSDDAGAKTILFPEQDAAKSDTAAQQFRRCA